jgi:hypothetical protein
MRNNWPTVRPGAENPDTYPDGGAARFGAGGTDQRGHGQRQRLRVAVWLGNPAHAPLLLFNGIGARLAAPTSIIHGSDGPRRRGARSASENRGR